MESVDCVIVGAGVVGLAVARALARTGREVIVLEKADGIGTETSSRNSEVVHAGIYYRPGSLMARLCVEGRQQLYAYCAEHGVPHWRCGKLIVANSEAETATLAEIMMRASENGVDDLRRLSEDEARALEPKLSCLGGLLSPSTGIVDSHALMLAFQGEAVLAGAAFAFQSPLEGAKVDSTGLVLRVGGAEAMNLRCKVLVNAAGLCAPDLARQIIGMPAEKVPPAFYAKGNYFTLAGHSPFSRLIYPVPHPGGLGVHLTIDLAGQARFGPDIEWVETINYDVDPARADLFYEAIRRYWPGLPTGALQPGYSGIRPKIVPPTVAVQDFVIQGPADHGVTGLINFFGIESPGLTASLALANFAVELAHNRART